MDVNKVIQWAAAKTLQIEKTSDTILHLFSSSFQRFLSFCGIFLIDSGVSSHSAINRRVFIASLVKLLITGRLPYQVNNRSQQWVKLWRSLVFCLRLMSDCCTLCCYGSRTTTEVCRVLGGIRKNSEVTLETACIGWTFLFPSLFDELTAGTFPWGRLANSDVTSPRLYRPTILSLYSYSMHAF